MTAYWGLQAIRARGGTTIGQSLDDAMFPALPAKARDAGVLDQQAAAADMGGILKRLSQREIKDPNMEPDARTEIENRIAMMRRFSTTFDAQELGPASGYTCPDCNGSLVSIGEGHFRCRIGHAWTTDSLVAARDGEIENALSVALRSLQEKAKLARQLADGVGHGPLFRHYTALAEETENALNVLGDRLSASGPPAR